MPFLRLTRDSRGNETTILLHAARPGEAPRVLYWYRTAPGVRVGRPPLDEDAIRTIEEQHPDIEFDWPHILEVGATLAPEVERRPERPRRRPRVAEPSSAEPIELPDGDMAVSGAAVEDVEQPVGPSEPAAPVRPITSAARIAPVTPEIVPALRPRSALLDELVGREIAARLRERYAELVARASDVLDPVARAAWHARADALDPDSWVTPEAVLRGVEHADRLLDELRRELP